MKHARVVFGLDLNGQRAGIRWAPERTKGIVLNNETSAAPRGFLLRFGGMGGPTKERMDSIRRLHGWDGRTFKLTVSIANNQIYIGGYQSNRDALPEGVYRFWLDISDLKVRGNPTRVTVRDGTATSCVLRATEDPRTVMLSGNNRAAFDGQIARLLGDNQPPLDDLPPLDWLLSDKPRERRKACLLNLMAKLRTAPTPAEPLIEHIRSVIFADVDRIYCEVDADLYRRLENLSDRTRRNVFFDEGKPHSGTHKRLLQFATGKSGYKLRSFRQEGRPSMQLTVACPEDASERFYADADLDLGNPLQDLVGFAIHMGEVAMPGRTDHFKLRKRLMRGDVGQFIYYEIDK